MFSVHLQLNHHLPHRRSSRLSAKPKLNYSSRSADDVDYSSFNFDNCNVSSDSDSITHINNQQQHDTAQCSATSADAMTSISKQQQLQMRLQQMLFDAKMEENDSQNMSVSNNSISTTINSHNAMSTPTASSSLTVSETTMYDSALAADSDSLTYKQAMKDSNREQWQRAVQSELDSHAENNTWSFVNREPDMNVIGAKWLFKEKRDEKGDTVKFKARLVAQGFSQEQGIDYDEVFAPVLKTKSLRLLLALATSTTKLFHLDVKTAFLNATVKENIYVRVPDGVNAPDGMVLKLNKALYGIKQAPYEWNKHMHGTLISLGFKQCSNDTCVYFKRTRSHNQIRVGLFVDDVLISVEDCDINEWNNIKHSLMSTYQMSDLGEASHVLGMRIVRLPNGSLTIDQRRYIKDKLSEFSMLTCREVDTPEQKDISVNNENKINLIKLDTAQHGLYRAIVGSLIYATVSTRPDISHAVNMLSRHMASPTAGDLVAAKRTLRYLRGSVNHGLLYSPYSPNEPNSVTLSGYCDADWAGDKEDRKSTTGYCMYVNGNLVSWNCKKQQTVALSSAESELMAATELVKELKWAKGLLIDMGFNVNQPMIMYCDNQAAIQIAAHDTHHDRVKHIAIRHFFIRDEIKSGAIKMEWVSTQQQMADIFTKTLGSTLFTKFVDKIMIRTQD